jgi:hypothetical protein
MPHERRSFSPALLFLISLVAFVFAWWPAAATQTLSTAAYVRKNAFHPLRHIRLAARSQQTHSYTVQPGDTLSLIAGKLLGSPSRWPDLWWWNRQQIRNPDQITVGQVLDVWRWNPPYASWEPYVTAQADAAIPKPPPPAPAPAPVAQSQGGQAQAPAPAPVAQASGSLSGPWPGGAFGNCVVTRESGGNPQVMNSSGHYGLYQFSFSTWVAYGGAPGAFGNASPGEQEQVFLNAMATPGGAGNWAPYDGC